jgi:hypothetical protein
MPSPIPSAPTRTHYWILPAKRSRDGQPDDLLRAWLHQKMWGVNSSIRNHEDISQQFHTGDNVCFYVSKLGVVATAEVAGALDRLLDQDEIPPESAQEARRFYLMPLKNIRWLPKPVVIDSALRSRLDAFRGRSSAAPWAWFVLTAFQVSQHDFLILTQQEGTPMPVDKS